MQKTTLLAWATARRTSCSTKAMAKADAAAALRAADGSAFYTCPLCGHGFPLTMQSHADVCQGKGGPTGALGADGGRNRRLVVVEEDEAAGQGGTIFENKDMKHACRILASSAGAESSKLTTSPPMVSPSPSQMPFQSPPTGEGAFRASAPRLTSRIVTPSPGVSLDEGAARIPDSAALSGRGAANAFHVLRRAAHTQFRREAFTLFRCTETGALDWAWAPHAASPFHIPKEGARFRGPPDRQPQQWWEREVALPGSKTARLLLRTNIHPPPPTRDRSHHLPLPNVPIPVLKSALQKNVRRSRGEAAARVALQLLHRAPLELYRRMLIIMLEDTACHPPALVLFTWLMMAGEGFAPDAALRKVLARAVFEVASARVTDFSPSEYHPVLDAVSDMGEVGLEEGAEDGLSPECLTLLRCLRARRYHGGMPCDAHMLRSLGKLWRLRLGLRDPEEAGKMEEGAGRGAEGAGGGRAPELERLVHPPCLGAVPLPGWRPPPTPPLHQDPPCLVSCRAMALAPLDYLGPRKLAEYLDSPRPWLRWLIWQPHAQGQPVPRAWLPSLGLIAGEQAAPLPPASPSAPVPRAGASLVQRSLEAPPLEDWPAVWRLRPVSGGGRDEGDIPWSAIDFHVSGVVEEVYRFRLSAENRRRLAAMRARGVGGGSEGYEEMEAEAVKELLRSAMWRFSSSVTDKVSVLSAGEGRGQEEGVMRGSEEGNGKGRDKEGEGLREVWNLLRPLSHAYAQNFIKRRCCN